MFGFIKKLLESKKQVPEKIAPIKLLDIDANPLMNGDKVFSLRYGLEECLLHVTADGVFYESIKTGEKISYTKMVDAATELQKVRKIEDGSDY